MVSTFTPNVQLEEPARGDDVGTWDTPVNGNTTNLDLLIGAINVISLNNSNVVLSAAQYRSKQITFNSTLTGSVTITFPTSFTKSYEIQNLCTGTSAFTITLATTAAGGQVICCPPGETIDCFNDAANIKFKNLGRVGSFWEYAGSSVPGWVGGCTVPPYINCDGTSFSSATYPALAVVMAGTTLPDSRGRTRFTLNQGTARITAGVSFDGNTNYSGGGDQNYQLHSHTNTLTDPGHFHAVNAAQPGGGSTYLTWAAAGDAGTSVTGVWPVTGTNVTSISINNANAGTGGSGNVPPGYIGGLTLIRAG